jgi:hypothetical protein
VIDDDGYRPEPRGLRRLRPDTCPVAVTPPGIEVAPAGDEPAALVPWESIAEVVLRTVPDPRRRYAVRDLVGLRLRRHPSTVTHERDVTSRHFERARFAGAVHRFAPQVRIASDLPDGATAGRVSYRARPPRRVRVVPPAALVAAAVPVGWLATAGAWVPACFAGSLAATALVPTAETLRAGPPFALNRAGVVLGPRRWPDLDRGADFVPWCEVASIVSTEISVGWSQERAVCIVRRGDAAPSERRMLRGWSIDQARLFVAVRHLAPGVAVGWSISPYPYPGDHKPPPRD